MARDCTVEIFQRDIATHQMTVALNSGLHRHLKFRGKVHGWNLWFELITWPGCLTINGDMGTWTFSRLDDMFNFFRSGAGLKINASYWAEKLQHGVHGREDGAKVWDQDVFRENLLEQLGSYYDIEPLKLAEVKVAVEEEIFRRHDGDGPHLMRRAAYEFTYEYEADRDNRDYLEKLRSPRKVEKFQFEGTELPSGMVYSYHFIWCLYAIVWGIQQWDESLAQGAGPRAAAGKEGVGNAE